MVTVNGSLKGCAGRSDGAGSRGVSRALYRGASRVVEINRAIVVPRAHHTERPVTPGDVIEIVRILVGGG